MIYPSAWPRNQLLLFTALSEQAQVDMWSAANRKTLNTSRTSYIYI